jgi:hypothetical protein
MEITAQANRKLITVSEMAEGDFGVVVGGQFDGEVFFCNIAGIHSLSNRNRYWPSQYIESKGGNKLTAYVPDDTVRLLEIGDTLTRSK